MSTRLLAAALVTRPQSGWITAIIDSKLCYIFVFFYFFLGRVKLHGLSPWRWWCSNFEDIWWYHINDLPRLYLYKVLKLIKEVLAAQHCSNKTTNCTFSSACCRLWISVVVCVVSRCKGIYSFCSTRTILLCYWCTFISCTCLLDSLGNFLCEQSCVNCGFCIPVLSFITV